jgi:hypothetical protein
MARGRRRDNVTVVDVDNYNLGTLRRRIDARNQRH